MIGGAMRRSNEDLVLECLKRENRPLGAYEILRALRPMGVNSPPSVYRALAALSDQGLVHRIASLNAYVACPHGPHGPNTAFLICGRCGAVAEFPSETVFPQVYRQAATCGFAASRTSVEALGECAECQAKEAAKEH